MHFTDEQGHTGLPDSLLRFVASGAATLDVDWKRRVENFFDMPLQNGYGMTETTAGVCVTEHQKKNDDISVGKPFPGVEIRIDQQITQADTEVGEILVRGPNVMKGYFRNPEATKAAIDSDEWLHTGDLGTIDSAGALHIICLLYTSPSPRDATLSRMPSSA